MSRHSSHRQGYCNNGSFAISDQMKLIFRASLNKRVVQNDTDCILWLVCDAICVSRDIFTDLAAGKGVGVGGGGDGVGVGVGVMYGGGGGGGVSPITQKRLKI